jgi:hypothetical protein
MHETRSPTEIASLLKSSYPQALLGIIGVDGTDGVGKTTLANVLREVVGGSVVCLDEFVVNNRGRYIPHLRHRDLKTTLADRDRPVIIEGVCLLAALDAVSVEADVLIYIKRVASYGYWYDEETCDPEEQEEELIRRLSEEAEAFAKLEVPPAGDLDPVETTAGSLTPLREEIIRYHFKYRPSWRAQIVFLRLSDPPLQADR